MHAYPQFYACYLLKSIQTPHATATYIGSTPNPLRRIRQHNGEISQGARKTSRKRPWVMQMLVHGFPSKQAALQFEWAWQHTHISRHLKSKITKGRGLAQNIKNLSIMLASHPYDIQPLRVVIFTEAAGKHWDKLPKSAAAASTVLGGPAALDILSPIQAPPPLAHCHICTAALDRDPLSTAVCLSCAASAHLSCLAPAYLRQEGSSRMVPRGGHCVECGQYNLWGDMVKGMFSRVGTTKVMEDDDGDGGMDMDDAELEEDGSEPITPTKRKRRPASGTRQANDVALAGPSSPAKRGRPLKTTTAPRKRIGAKNDLQPQVVKKRGRPPKAPVANDSGGEEFDFGGIDSNPDLDDSDDGLPQTLPPLPVIKRKATAKPAVPKRRGRPPRVTPTDASTGEEFDFGGIDSNPELSDSPSPRKKRTPPKPKSTRSLHTLASTDALADRMSVLSVSSRDYDN